MTPAAWIALAAFAAVSVSAGAAGSGATGGPAGQARDLLVPSETSGDDCAAGATLRVVPDDAMRRLQRRICEAEVDPAFRATCAQLAREQRDIVFVDDHCAASDGSIEVSLGGKRHDVRRVGAAAPGMAATLAGDFQGDGLGMRVVPGKAIREASEDGEPIGLEQDVTVTLSIGQATRTLTAVYSHGP